jgi:signal transduction histidine kinase
MATPAFARSERAPVGRALGTMLPPALIAAVCVALAAVIALFWLGLPASHVQSLVGLLLASGAASLAVTCLAAALVLSTPGRLALKLAIVCAIGPVVAAINIYYTAEAMLIKQSDLGLLILLLVFSSGVAIAFATALARSLATRIARLAQAAQALGIDASLVRVPESEDEIGMLGRSLNRLADRLHESDRRRGDMEQERRMLLAAISHDLRTPLTSLRAVIDALDDGIIQDQQTAARYLGNSRQQVRQLERLIDDLFELARLEAGAQELDRAAVTVAAIVEEVVESARVHAETLAIALTASFEENLPSLFVDASRLGRALLNVVGNALHYTHPNGAVTVSACRQGAFVTISVRDTGTGIAAGDLPYVFDSFYRGEKSRSRQHGGAGLGLAIARALVEAHGGRTWADSEPGIGTAVHLSLPIAQT